ncbi:MAG: GxxExxY protein [Gemmatimonadetes bacterium]|nr:GxxExxY protein [Gemmatimonadota bacterium]
MKGTDRAPWTHFPSIDLTGVILGAFFKVFNALGHGFLERVYVRALAQEMRERGLRVELEVPLDVYYGERCVGTYRADCVVQRRVILEIKAVDRLCHAHQAQLLHYLRSTPIEVGLLLNFGPRPEFRRLAFSNARKERR